MTFLSSLDAKDRKLLLWCVGIAIALAVATGFLMPNGNDNDNPLPSTYLAGQHGARAAYETLLRSNYQIERWERPLSELAATAGPETVVIFAQPFSREPDDIKAVRKIVERGGRVLSTGYMGRIHSARRGQRHAQEFHFAACKLEPEGLDALAGVGRGVDGSAGHLGWWATRRIASSTVAQVIRRWWSTTGARGTSSGGPARRRWKTARSAAPTTSTCCWLRWGRARAIASIGTSRCMGRFARVWSYAGGPGAGPCCGYGLPIAGAAGRLQLQPAQRAGARPAAAGARHAHRVS